MTTPSPSPPILLSPPSTGERLARCTAPPAHSLPPPLAVINHHLHYNHYYHPLYILTPNDSRDEIPESEQTQLSRVFVCPLYASKYEIVEVLLPDLPGIEGVVHLLMGDINDTPGGSVDGGGGGLCFPRGLGSLDRIESGDLSGASDPP
ncbi:hypothetical protein Tco_1156337 [Tanacetum coccineum]